MPSARHSSADPEPPRAGRALGGRLGWFLLVVVVAAGFGVVASRSPAPDAGPPTGDAAVAAAAIDTMLDPGFSGDPLAVLPKDFTKVTDVDPARATDPAGRDRAVHAGGGCSTPWGDDDTRWDYSVGCKAHDLGYDLLRYAEEKGEPLGPDPRRRLDQQLAEDMHGQCERNPQGSAGTCRIVATLYSAGLVVNSWHQRWGPPRAEPIGLWTAGLLVVIALLVVRVPVLRRTRQHRPRQPQPVLSPDEGDRASYLGFLRMVSLGGFVLAESVLALAPLLDLTAASLWPMTWLLQLVPLFFFAGGHSNLLAWQATTTGYGGYLARRVCWLIRPVLAFVTAWLVLPLSLDLVNAPPEAVRTVGRLVVQPLWLLGLYLLVVAMTPAMLWLHRRAPVLTPLAQAAVVVGIGVFGSGVFAAHLGGVVLAALFGQLAFHYADGTLWRLPRAVLVAVGLAALAALAALTTVGPLSPLVMAEPTGSASFVPSAPAVLLIGLAQVCLVALPRRAGARAIARSAPAQAARFVHSAPMTVYLAYLCAMLVIAGIIGAARSAGLPTTGVDWLVQPRPLLALALLGVPTALAFVLFEWRSTLDPDAGAAQDRAGSRWDAVAATLGTGYGAIGILGFAVTGLTGTHTSPVLLGVPLDPMSSIVHLLLGWYLLHSVRTGTTATPWPWLLTAIACLPPIAGSSGLTVHWVTLALALGLATSRFLAHRRRSESQGRAHGEALATAESVP
ncbi:phospholipase A2 [Actinokineospora alba]|uniref:Phospholipase A2 n=1 Tax=Actinokineospora alba TaxID=504798 RepID=A0A1H0VJ88_9PSEU|nr:phospholipase A2-like protein [Actinokineospora alba]SDJ28597.1 phospholipase A2 [Actinokineospora alba]SDP78649.1 phospholipase A2 [Actinokineospora alba]